MAHHAFVISFLLALAVGILGVVVAEGRMSIGILRGLGSVRNRFGLGIGGGFRKFSGGGGRLRGCLLARLLC